MGRKIRYIQQPFVIIVTLQTRSIRVRLSATGSLFHWKVR